MKDKNSSTARKAAAARENGRKGGTKSPDRSRWNAVRHALNAITLTIHEGDHLPEYPQFVALHAELVKLLSPVSVLELIAIDKFVADLWRLHRAFRFELSETEKRDNGMLSPGIANVLRYLNSANRQFAESYARIMEICERKKTSAAAQLAAAATRDFGGDQLTPSQPAAADALPKTAAVNVESLDSAPIQCNPEDGGESEQPTSPPSASAQPGDASHSTEEAAPSSEAAAAAQPAQSPGFVTPAPSVGEEEKGDNPGAG